MFTSTPKLKEGRLLEITMTSVFAQPPSSTSMVYVPAWVMVYVFWVELLETIVVPSSFQVNVTPVWTATPEFKD